MNILVFPRSGKTGELYPYLTMPVLIWIEILLDPKSRKASPVAHHYRNEQSACTNFLGVKGSETSGGMFSKRPNF